MFERDQHPTDPQPADAADPFSTFVPAETRDSDSPREVKFDQLVRGDTVGAFRIQRLLGRGSFGAVYLARELTLDRLVAVKVVLPDGQQATAGEGRSLAQLRHPNIVGIFGEARDSKSGCHLLWMQFVDGCDLATVIQRLWDQRDGTDWTESDFVKNCSSDVSSTETLNRVEATRGSIELVCDVGSQLAKALDHAHGCGIVHRDIKPANILMSRDGIPMLADFNLAENATAGDSQRLGGTLAYMPPEQIAVWLGETKRIDACRADIYSLGMVLWELVNGERPFADQEEQLTTSGQQKIIDLMNVRREAVYRKAPGAKLGLEMILRRAMAVDPTSRFPSARALATALQGLAELQRARRDAPARKSLFLLFRNHLFWFILIGGLVPHLCASVLQIYFNNTWIEPDDEFFTKALIAYNMVVYPGCIGWLSRNLFRFASGYRRVIAREEMPRGAFRKLRRQMLRLPRQFAIVAAFGWFPGIYLFPWLLDYFGATTSAEDWTHFAMSFAIAGAIAMTYSYALVLYLVCVYGYRACWQTGTHYRERARYELRGMEKRIGRVSILVGVLPLAAAVLLLALAPQAEFNNATQIARLHRLVIALIVFGGFGLYLVVIGSARLSRVVRALTLSQE
ncbi:MAG: serine/threonine protein kinase [Planctomycetaceae bacterium]|nr:serine/threonine protein kinase [Planctomycetaceae bacterium]